MAVNFLLTGAESAQMAAQDAAQKKEAYEGSFRLQRFFLVDKPNENEAKITFIDGDLNHDGLLIPPRAYEHNLKIQGKWGNIYICPEKTVPSGGYKCPICATGDKPALVAFFTIIDHRSYKSTKTGKVYENTRKLLVAKPQSMEYLAKIAVKRDGLARATFDVSRMGEQSASIGSMFDFIGKTDLAELQASFQQPVLNDKGEPTNQMQTYFVPADYNHELQFFTPEELVAKGLGAASYGGAPAQPGGGGTSLWNKGKEASGGAGMSPGGYTPPGQTNYGSKL